MSDSDSVNFGRNVRAERIRQGISQTKLAQIVGHSRPFLVMIETHGTNTSLATAQTIARALGTTIDELLREPPACLHTALCRDQDGWRCRECGRRLTVQISDQQA